MDCWDNWKEYKREEFGFKYKSPKTEQAQLMKLTTLSESNENNAIAIINQSIESGWKGFFELKNNGTTKTNNRTRTFSAEGFKAALANEGHDISRLE